MPDKTIYESPRIKQLLEEVVYQEYAGFHDHIWGQITIADALVALYKP